MNAQLAWEVALGLFLVWILMLWRRPVPAQGAAWSNEGLTMVLSQALVFSLYGLLEAHVGNHGRWFLVALAAWSLGWWAAYFGLRWARCRGDRLLLPLACLLSGLGWVMQLRLEQALAVNQACWVLVGLATLILVTAYLKRLDQLRRWYGPLLILCLGLQCGLFVFGKERNGAALWYALGPFSFQPVEIVKVLVVCLLAILLAPAAQDPKRLTRPVLAVMAGAWLLLETLLVLQKDLGPALLFFGLFLAMLYLVSGRLRWVLGLLCLSLFGAMAAYNRFGHVRVRVEAWLDPLGHYQDSGYQISEALFALAWGGWQGTGLGLGEPYRIPEAATDFIYVAWCEELGTLGGCLLWGILTLFLLRCFRAAQVSQDPFERLLAAGLACLMSWQSCVVLFGILKLMPMTGITLPFISYGGSSLLSNFVILALLLRMTRREL
ncbi:MAG: FtsW/RodA/SpoVE family cell cycle protein [Candidatus Eremiobacteraeota bacterium]|nr:FtsW/RodA/SpoVE family cell cycle protein [Candidatus Eremiobacteraeota bacterium]MCW5866461.1 FtsW/RodA/SpoVE family cell cycle protein [Candidatus Eremiobacteraeota bacterium]